MRPFQSMGSPPMIPIDITALLRKSTGQGLAMATGAWIQSSCLINGTACTYSKLSPLAVKLLAWLYDWAFIAHINPPSLWFLWNASDAYKPHRGRSVVALCWNNAAASTPWGSCYSHLRRSSASSEDFIIIIYIYTFLHNIFHRYLLV